MESATTPTNKYIDIDKVIADKNAQWLPFFVKRYLKRIVHEKEINQVMAKIGHLEGLEFIDAALDYLNTTVEVKDIENMPKEGGVIVAANHPLGGLDGMALMKAVGKVRTDFQFLVNDVLLSIENLKPLFVPVNKFGVNPRMASKIIEEAYASDMAVLNFPAGLVSRKQPQGIEDLEWKKSFIAKAIRYKKDVVPVHIDGRNSNFFYNLSRLRRRLGIKANIEMLYLADELFGQRNETLRITFGEPIPWQRFDKSKSQAEWASYVRELVYNLPKSNEQ